MDIKQTMHEYSDKFRGAFLIPEVTGPLFAVGLTGIGLFQTQNAVSILVGIVWGIIAYAVFRGKTRWWLAIIILVITGGLLYWVNPFVVKLAMSSGNKESSQVPTLKASPESEHGLIKNGGFEKGFDGLEDWVSSERPRKMLYTSLDAAAILQAKHYVMRAEPLQGDSNSNGLIIECTEKPGSNEYFSLAQEIDGLEHDKTYEVSYSVYSDKHTSYTLESVYMVLGVPWQTENNESGRIFSQEIKPGWNQYKMTLINHGGKRATFMIVVNDVTHNVRIDDISLKLTHSRVNAGRSDRTSDSRSSDQIKGGKAPKQQPT